MPGDDAPAGAVRNGLIGRDAYIDRVASHTGRHIRLVIAGGPVRRCPMFLRRQTRVIAAVTHRFPVPRLA